MRTVLKIGQSAKIPTAQPNSKLWMSAELNPPHKMRHLAQTSILTYRSSKSGASELLPRKKPSGILFGQYELQQRPCVGFAPSFHTLYFKLSCHFDIQKYSIALLPCQAAPIPLDTEKKHDYNLIRGKHMPLLQLKMGKQGEIPSQVRYRYSRDTMCHFLCATEGCEMSCFDCFPPVVSPGDLLF